MSQGPVKPLALCRLLLQQPKKETHEGFLRASGLGRYHVRKHVTDIEFVNV